LEVFNSVIQHNLADNSNLVYGILTAHKSFEDLGTFTLARALKRVQLAKEEQARKVEANPKSKNTDAPGEEEPHVEKARLLESESSSALRRSMESVDENLWRSEGQEPRIEHEFLMTQPLMSPSGEIIPITAISEKVRGKMKARRSISLDTTANLDRVAAMGVGRNGFVPTQEWVTSWQQGLPLDSVMLVISELLPKVQELQASRYKSNLTSAIMDFLGSATLKHILPPMTALTPRRFLWSDASIIWLTSLIWGEIYVRGMTPLGIWNSTNVRLFYVKHAQAQQRQITETVSSVVGGLLGRNPDSPQRGGQRHDAK